MTETAGITKSRRRVFFPGSRAAGSRRENTMEGGAQSGGRLSYCWSPPCSVSVYDDVEHRDQ
jgi:hypothetical protein